LRAAEITRRWSLDAKSSKPSWIETTAFFSNGFIPPVSLATIDSLKILRRLPPSLSAEWPARQLTRYLNARLEADGREVHSAGAACYLLPTQASCGRLFTGLNIRPSNCYMTLFIL
jgi:hypothetical protein